MQLVEQGDVSQEEEEGVAYMCGICRELFSNASEVSINLCKYGLPVQLCTSKI